MTGEKSRSHFLSPTKVRFITGETRHLRRNRWRGKRVRRNDEPRNDVRGTMS
ncbi:hypothetical protein AALP_AA2G014200 [Arabis alpina]|uniref:Uncharacterized protein n=1 Tax=Arabis alpina TaxID=50452 RepID=A0A087HEM4_ARAAL|nr:hypothetical protein AALP_AA2G014200 [Arabis alpina]